MISKTKLSYYGTVALFSLLLMFLVLAPVAIILIELKDACG